MSFALHCNVFQCHIQLTDRAVVTTCCHIFCLNCSDTLGLRNPINGIPKCPACHIQLPYADNVVVTELNPTEDYKTSVLSGLSPTIIMDCASRGLAFYSYQVAQEIALQEYQIKKKTNDNAGIKARIEKITHDASAEIKMLQEKLTAMEIGNRELEKKNHDLMDAFRQKAAQYQRSYKLYQSLKAQVNAAKMARTPSENFDNNLQSAHNTQFVDKVSSRGSNTQVSSILGHFPTGRLPRNASNNMQYQHSSASKNWPGQSQGIRNRACNSQMKPPEQLEPISYDFGSSHSIDAAKQRMPIARQPLGNLHPNTERPELNDFRVSTATRMGKQTRGSASHPTPLGMRQGGLPNTMLR